MNYTENYQLPQWVETDRVLMEDFNDNNEKIDAALAEMAQAAAGAGNCRIVYGSYQGTGEYGPSHPTTLTFTGKPLAILVSGMYQFFSVRGTTSAVAYYSSNQEAMESLTWGENSVSWVSASAGQQLNENNTSYYYIALLATDE